MSRCDGCVDFPDDRLQFPSKDLVHPAPGCSLTGKGRQVSPQGQVSTFNGKPNSTVCQIRSKDKAPCSTEIEMGPCICFIRGLRVSRLLDLEAVFGSKSDTPTRAKNCEASYSNGQEKTRKTEIGALEPRSLREQQKNSGNGGRMGSIILDTGCLILDTGCWPARKTGGPRIPVSDFKYVATSARQGTRKSASS
jgi:hypothetical protein